MALPGPSHLSLFPCGGSSEPVRPRSGLGQPGCASARPRSVPPAARALQPSLLLSMPERLQQTPITLHNHSEALCGLRPLLRSPTPAPPQPRLSPASPLPPLRQRLRSPPTGGPNHRAQERGARALPRPAAVCLTAARQCLYFLTPLAPARDGLGPQSRSLPPMGGRGGCARICARGAVRGAGPARERRRSGGAHPQP